MDRWDITLNGWGRFELGPWVLHYDARRRIAELEAQLATMTDERDSESRWAKEYSDRVTALEERLASAQERERWIPVTEQHPEKDGWYLVRGKNWVFIGEFIKGWGWYDFQEEPITITHWCPLPDPPEADHA